MEHFLSRNEKEVKKIEDPIKARNKMFEKVLEKLPEFRHTLSESATVDPVGYVFRNSIQDGLELARQAGLTPAEIYKTTLGRSLFCLSHKEVVVQSGRLMESMGLPTKYQMLDLFKRFHADQDFKNDFNETGYVAYDQTLRTQIDDMKTRNPGVYWDINDYYREFLPYRAEELAKSEEEALELKKLLERKNKKGNVPEESDVEKRGRSINQAMDVLLPKYFKVLEDIILKGDTESLPLRTTSMERLEAQGFSLGEASVLTVYFESYWEMKNNPEKLPELVMRGPSGFKQSWNLEAARKPVAKIVENMRKKALTKNVEKLLDQYGQRGKDKDAYKIVFDPIFGKHIATREPFHMPTAHGCAEEIISTQEIVKIVGKIINRMPEESKDLSFDTLGSELEVALKQEGNEDLHDAYKALNKGEDDFTNYGPIEDVVPLFLEATQEESAKDYAEAYIISKRIDGNLLTGIAEYLNDCFEKKNKSSLSEKNLAILAAKLEDKIKDGAIPYSASSADKEDLEAGMTLLDAFKDPSMENMLKAFPVKSSDELYGEKKKIEEKTKELFNKSKRAFDFFKKTLQDKGQFLMRTMGAKPDQNPNRLAEQLIAASFPAEYQAYQERQGQESKNFGWGNFGLSKDRSGLGLMKNRFESLMAGGNVGGPESKEGGSKMSVTLDRSYNGMMITNIIAYSPSTGKWGRTHIPIDGDMKTGRKYEHIRAKQSESVHGAMVVPTPLGAENIFTNRGVVEKDSLGIVMSAQSDGKLESWSYDVPTGHLAPMNITDKEYTRFLDRLVVEGGSAYLEKISGLPVECQMFLDSIVDLAPRDRVSAIQKFITNHSFYDAYDNPLRDEMNQSSVSDRIGYMEERLQQLRAELGDEVPSNSMFAGVCADFTVIGEMMLRASGIAAGAAEGYRVSGTTFNSNNAHGLNVIIWPDSNGKNTLCEVDMTPSAVTAAQQKAFAMLGIKPVLVEETINESQEQEKHHIEELKKNLDTITQGLNVMATANPDQVDLKQFKESLIDYISATCSLGDVYVFKRMIETYKFSPVHTLEKSPEKKVEAIGFMQGEYKRWNEDYQTKDEPMERLNNAGKNLMGAFQKCYAQSKIDHEQEKLQDMIVSIPEYLNTSLSDKHKKLWEYFGQYAKLQK